MYADVRGGSIKPSILCRYGPRDLPTVLDDVETLMRALPPGGILRLTTEQREATQALAKWCLRTGNFVVREDEELVRGEAGCVLALFFDIQRHMRVDGPCQ